MDPNGRPGLGARLHAELRRPVIGAAKTRSATAAPAVPVLRGHATRPLFVTAAGLPAADAAELDPADERPLPLPPRPALG